MAVLVGGKGRGSNMANLVVAGRDGRLPAEVVLVVATREGVPAISRARELGVPVAVVPPGGEAYGGDLVAALREAGVGWVCLAGYLTLLPQAVVEAYRGRVLNVHPALLPKFGGKGMYGMRVHAAVLAAGEQESGCTVHHVDEVYDNGDVVLQLRCPVLPGDTPEELAARVLELEHQAYPQALARLIQREAPPPTPSS